MSFRSSDFNIILNSANRVGGNINNAQYFVDFGLFDEGQYELTFTFMSSSIPLSDRSVPAILNIDFGSNNNIISPSSSSQNIGFISTYYNIGANSYGYLKAACIDNVPIVMTRPRNNIFTVSYLAIDTLLPWTNFANNAPANYSLMLNFKKLS